MHLRHKQILCWERRTSSTCFTFKDFRRHFSLMSLKFFATQPDYLYSSCTFYTPDKAFATSSQWTFRFQVEDAFGCSHGTNTSTPSDLVDTLQSVAIEAHISSGPSVGLFIYGLMSRKTPAISTTTATHSTAITT